jgi:ryanodine receptor 2
VNYEPKPIPIEGVHLPKELSSLTELLAENSHDLWACQRLAEGWRFGPQRDESQKLHPSLVPYAELPEGEKDYDRIAVIGALKAIIKLGYRIVPPEE